MLGVLDKLRTWDAWYSGDPEALAAMYGSLTYNPRDPSSPFDRYGLLINRPSQYRGGMVGRFARMFWGTPTPLGERPHKLHIPVAGDLAATSADLLFGEMPKLSVEHTQTQDLLEQMVVDDGVHAALLEGAELAAALGGVYVRIAWDRQVSDRPWLCAAHADAAIPEWRWNRLSAVTFWEVLATPGTSQTTVLRHLERHEPGAIFHGLYEGTADQLGRPVPLAEHAGTAALAGIVDEYSAVPTGVDKLTVVYVPNMRPNRSWRADPAATNLGRSDYAAVEGAMDALDETWTSWMRDIRLGKARLIVPDLYLQNLGSGKGAYFDAEQEVFTGLSMLPKPDGAGNMITENQFKIRVAEHSTTAKELLSVIIRDAGYSAVTFGELTGASNVATATEVNARERKTLTTRSRKIGYWRPQLADIVETLLAITANMAPELGVQPARPDVEWPDAVAPSQADTAAAIQLLHAAEAISRRTSVQMAHPDWDDTRIDEEVRLIVAELLAVPDPTQLGGVLEPHPGVPA